MGEEIDIDSMEVDAFGYAGYFEGGFDSSVYAKNSLAIYKVLSQFKEIKPSAADSIIARAHEGTFGDINGAPSNTTFTTTAMATAERVKVLMEMIMFLQMDPQNFEKFFQYGCWCFPDGARSVIGGYGEPRDGADMVCKRYHKCQQCINQDYVDCPEWAGYKYRGIIDKKTGKKRIECLNKSGCRKDHCECDSKLAQDLAEYEMLWDPMLNQQYGGFDRTTECPLQDVRSNNVNNEHECCGKYPNRFPYVSKSQSGELRKCCKSKTYDPRTLACCHDGELRAAGSCMTYDEYKQSL